MKTILVGGTDSYKNDGTVDWYCPNSPFAQYLESVSVRPLFAEGRGFIWSTEVDGVPPYPRRHRIWAASGANLADYAIARGHVPGTELGVISHSHGLQVVLYACAQYGLKIAHLVSLTGPVRGDMMDVAKAARPNIGYWTHLYSDRSDYMQWLGELFDGDWRWPGSVRAHPLAVADGKGRNIAVPHVGHSRLVRDPSLFHYWQEQGWLWGLTEAV